MRETVAESENPVLLYSIGKDSSVLLHLAMKAFYPAKPPFPLLHVDTTWKFREMIEFRDQRAKELGLDLIVHTNQDGIARGIGPISHGSEVHTDVMKTQALRQALDKYGFDAAIGGARRDEDKSRAKERIFSFRNAQHRWDPKRQRPEPWRLFNARKRKGESVRVFPLSNWTELDIWLYIHRENIPGRAAVFLRHAPDRGARRHAHHARRRAAAAGARRNAGDAQRALPHARLLSAHRRDREQCHQPLRHHPGNDFLALFRAPRPRDRPRRRRLDGAQEAGRLLLMTAHPNPDTFAIDEFLRAQEDKSLLRFIACGSVDHGKSSLLGRLLYESNLLFEDQLTTLRNDSKRHGAADNELDYSLLLDGLAAEREQKITIDVAYRFFSTAKRKFIVIDAPGHEQYTRNMATGASNADLALLLVDAQAGFTAQTRRHALLVAMLGVKHLVLAVNKMDLVGWSQEAFEKIEENFRSFAAGLDVENIVVIPLSAKGGDNVVQRSEHAPWYAGPTLLDHLENVSLKPAARYQPLRMPVQWVNRPDANFRGYCGTIASGEAFPGMPVKLLPSGQTTKIAAIVTADGDLARAGAGQGGDAHAANRSRRLARRRDRRGRRQRRMPRARFTRRFSGWRMPRCSPAAGCWSRLAPPPRRPPSGRA